MPATISVNFATQAEVENSPQPTNKSVSAKVLADVLGGGSLGGGYVRIAGSTMTGALTLNAAPTSDLHAATKKYVDDNSKQAKYYYNIAAPTSTVSGPDNSSPSRTLDFTTTVGVDVYRNGVLLVGNGVDYTANVSTKTITFTTALAAGAIIQVNVGGVGTTIAPAPGVSQLQAGGGIALSPAGGTGNVTVSLDSVITGNRRFSGFTQFGNASISSQTFRYSSSVNDTGQNLAIVDGDNFADVNLAQIRYSINTSSRNYAAYLKLAKSNSNTLGTHTKVVNNQPIGGIAMFGSDGTNFVAGASIDAEAVGSSTDITTNCVPMRLRFCTRNAGDTDVLNERMIIGSAGNVTIKNNLEVQGTRSTGIIPVGMIAAFPATVPPDGWLKCNGFTLLRGDYPALWTYANTQSNNIVPEASWDPNNRGAFSRGDGSTTFRVPDLRGEFIRGWADGRSVDTGRGIGTAQGFAMQQHSHNLYAAQNGGSVRSMNNSGGAFDIFKYFATEGANATTADETRPRNIALLYCIKYE